MASSATPPSKPFHARIFRIYLDYLAERHQWNSEKFSEFFERLAYPRERLMEDSTWLDVEFSDRFYQIIKVMTGDENIAFNAGKFVKKTTLSSAFYHLLRGLISLRRMYQLAAKVTPFFSRAAVMSVLEIRDQAALLESRPVSGIPERPYMCENRRGLLIGMPQIHDLPLAHLEELECFHQGGARCLYRVKWSEPKTSHGLIFLLTLGALGLGLQIASVQALRAIDLLIYSVFAASSIIVFLTRKFVSQRKELESQNLVLEDSLRANERKHRELEIIGEISRLTNALHSPHEISHRLVRSVCELLAYDRALFMVVESERQVLKVAAHHGYDAELNQLFSETEFNIRPDNTTGFFVRVVNTKKPVLIQTMDQSLDQLSARSQKFAKILGSKSFVAVPLINKNAEVIGVLSVDYTQAEKVMKPEDEDLLMTLADHISISFHNSRVLEELQQSLETTKSVLAKQENVKSVFQKFIPSELANEILNHTRPQEMEQSLRAVRKKHVAVLFLDIFGFSKISSNLAPELVVDLLNTACSDWARCIAMNRGYIDKFTGDGLMALFQETSGSLDAAKAAIELIDSIPSINEKLDCKSLPEISIGVGLHFGPAIIGNIGSEDRLNFTAIGDTVNLASRFESHTRSIGPNTICASAPFRYQAGNSFAWKALGPIHLKGITEVFDAFQLMNGATAQQQTELKITRSKN